MQEKIIVSFTSYGLRLHNIPAVLDTIYSQTVSPDLVVLNLAYDEILPEAVASYLQQHCVEVNRVADTKVFKKIAPTLKKYPHDVVINIDDDWLYPDGMISDFMEMHSRYPDHPISGNGAVFREMIIHCGCASLTKAEYFAPYLDEFEKLIAYCPCDDIAYTYFANRTGHPYIVSNGRYFLNMTPYCEGEGYSETVPWGALKTGLDYLETSYGELPCFAEAYVKEAKLAQTLYHIHQESLKEMVEAEKEEAEKKVRSTRAYRLGKFMLNPFLWVCGRKGN